MKDEMTIRLNLGCGPHTIQGFTNIDLADHPGVIRHDLSNGLPAHFSVPFSVDCIFTEHFIEHLTREQALRLLTECYYVLKPGGILRVSTPNLRYLTQLYLKERLTEWSPTWNPTTPCQMVNEGMRSWGHQFLYDAMELRLILSQAGFKGMEEVRYRHSDHQALNGLEVRPYVHDLIFEAIKEKP